MARLRPFRLLPFVFHGLTALAEINRPLPQAVLTTFLLPA
jgi:hypothetical protein